jgi:hypothetical protein
MWKRTVPFVVGLLSVAAVAVAPAAAQIQTGSLLVRVLDEQGSVVPGVTITITSPVMPRVGRA